MAIDFSYDNFIWGADAILLAASAYLIYEGLGYRRLNQKAKQTIHELKELSSHLNLGVRPSIIKNETGIVYSKAVREMEKLRLPFFSGRLRDNCINTFNCRYFLEL